MNIVKVKNKNTEGKFGVGSFWENERSKDVYELVSLIEQTYAGKKVILVDTALGAPWTHPHTVKNERDLTYKEWKDIIGDSKFKRIIGTITIEVEGD